MCPPAYIYEDLLPKSNHPRTANEQVEFLRFQRLMTQGKVREATRYVTRRFREGGGLDPNAVAEPASKTPENLMVFEMLKKKHPTATPADPSVFPSKEEAYSLSPLPKVMITLGREG